MEDKNFFKIRTVILALPILYHVEVSPYYNFRVHLFLIAIGSAIFNPTIIITVVIRDLQNHQISIFM